MDSISLSLFHSSFSFSTRMVRDRKQLHLSTSYLVRSNFLHVRLPQTYFKDAGQSLYYYKLDRPAKPQNR